MATCCDPGRPSTAAVIGGDLDHGAAAGDLDGPLPWSRPTAAEADLSRGLDRPRPSCWAVQPEAPTEDTAARVNQRIAEKWPAIRAAIGAISLHADMLSLVLKEAKAPRTPEDLGWPRASYQAAVRHAREIRNRYTFLDLAADASVLDRMIPQIT
jgi:glycerol-1-phosphate dehydrogenase [NAD(P)+]